MSAFTLSTIRQNLSKFNFNDLSIPALVLLIMGMLVIPLHPVLLAEIRAHRSTLLFANSSSTVV